MAEEFETEEQRVEALQKWWKDNRKSVITGLIAGTAIVFGWNAWQAYQEEQAMSASDLYQQILSISTDPSKTEELEVLTNQLMTDYDSTAYSAFAALFLAKTKAEAGNNQDALQLLNSASQKAPFKGFENMVKLRILRLLLADKKADEALKILATIDPLEAGEFEAQFEEVKGDALLAMNRPNEARTAYQRSQELGIKSGLLNLKLNDLAEPEVSVVPEN
ncbi:MAG: tetratricopeptide repeat protein [Gammaproteobacteria bacterium]|nr:tetratricopeptide repeat protein [Gammaproteobacteria bacterium]